LAGPIKDIAWDLEGKRLVFTGEGGTAGDASNSRVIQWDTGVRCGELQNHSRKKGSTCDFSPCRPMRIVTGGSDDATVYLHSGLPFSRTIGEHVAEKCHERGSVNKVRYNTNGTILCSVGTDGSVIFYEGKTMSLIKKVEKVHSSSVFGCAWNKSGEYVLTCGADGYARLLDGRAVVGGENDALGNVVHEWNVSEILLQQNQLGGGGGGGNNEKPHLSG
jgi:WD40 repeat protein